MPKKSSFGLSNKCFPGKVDLNEIVKSIKAKSRSNGKIKDEIKSKARDSEGPTTEGANATQNTSSKTAPMGSPNIAISKDPKNYYNSYDDFKIDVKPSCDSLFDILEGCDTDEETSHNIVYSAIAEFVQPKEINLKNLKRKFHDDDKKFSTILVRTHKFLKLNYRIMSLGLFCVFMYMIYVIFLEE